MGSNNDDVKVTLRTGDGHIISVDKEVAFESKMLKTIIQIVGEDQLAHQEMPVSTVSKQTLEKMFEYIEYHLRNSSQPANVIRTWDLNFIADVDIDMLINLIKAADWLGVESLLKLAVEEFARDSCPGQRIVEENRIIS